LGVIAPSPTLKTFSTQASEAASSEPEKSVTDASSAKQRGSARWRGFWTYHGYRSCAAAAACKTRDAFLVARVLLLELCRDR
jgi:hypothetical protein